jgi:DNA polymerase-3 subunit epsilon
MTLRARPIAFVDVETTGLDPLCDRVIEVAAATFTPDGELVAAFSTLVNPGRPVSAEITALTGITDEEARRGLDFDIALHELSATIFADGEPYVAAYNAPFDRAFLAAEWMRARTPLPRIFSYDFTWVDPLVWVWSRDRYVKGKGRHRLSVTAERYGIRVEEAHRALADVHTAHAVLRSREVTTHIASLVGVPFDEERFFLKQKRLAAQREDDIYEWLYQQRTTEWMAEREAAR